MKQKILGLNGKVNIMGGERFTPVLEDQSIAAKRIIYDYKHLYEKRTDPTVMVNIGISYRVNKLKHSSVWSLQVINLLGSSTSQGYYYNLKENKVAVDKYKIIIPNLSYKIEF